MDISASIRKLTNFFILGFVVLSGGLVYWQVVVAAQVTANSHNSRSCLLENSPWRGTIYDRNGVWLAKSVRDPVAQCGYQRVYADPSLAGLIGYYAGPNYAATGIEKQFDGYLSGRITGLSFDSTIDKLLHRSPVGNNLYLTIDERIQQLVNQHFDDPIQIDNQFTYETDRGAVIVTNPQTGEILAMLSRPTFDPNKLVQTVQKGDLSYYNQLNDDKIEQPLLERPLQGRYPPGSSYKTMTLIAGLDTGKTTLKQEFDQQHALGPINYNGQNIGPEGNNIPGTNHFPVTTEYGFTHSDNIIFAQIGVNTGFNAWMGYNREFYVEDQIPFDLPVATSHVLPAGRSEMASNELAADAFGQGFDFVTPFQMSLVDDAVANDGVLMQPMLVLKIADHSGNPINTFSSQSLNTVMKLQTAIDVRQAMFGVTRCGTGATVSDMFTSSASVGIIGKTGTAQVNNTANPHAWFITQAPYSLEASDQRPALTIVAIKENGGEGGYANGPMLAHMYTEIFAKGYVKVQFPPPVPSDYCTKTGLTQ